MDWAAHGSSWPNAYASRFIAARPHRWHVQTLGNDAAPVLLLLHGTGAATHSWRDLAPLLANHYHVVAPDLPGHGFTKLGALQRSGPDLMAQDTAALLDKLGVTPVAIIGHSAGAVLGLHLAGRLSPAPRALVALNGAFDTFPGAAGWLFPMMAKALALNPFIAPAVSRMTSERTVERLITSTGSQIDAEGLACYRACLADTAHVDGALTMMAQWRMEDLPRRLAHFAVPARLFTGARDGAVPPETSARAAARMPTATHLDLPGLGHLAHEEAPEAIATEILTFLDTTRPPPQQKTAAEEPGSRF